jgi:hypothetical protein
MTVDALRCYRCGTDLARLTLPLSRRDLCPSCRVDLHVCLMCRFYDKHVPEQCTEDDAVEVREKAKANFCDYFKPNPDAYVAGGMDAQRRAEADLEALFGNPSSQPESGPPDSTLSAHAEALFKR